MDLAAAEANSEDDQVHQDDGKQNNCGYHQPFVVLQELPSSLHMPTCPVSLIAFNRQEPDPGDKADCSKQQVEQEQRHDSPPQGDQRADESEERHNREDD
jgi:hypothetical protein